MFTRREIILSAVAAIVAGSVFGLHRHEDDMLQDIDWGEVLNRVIGDRNALIYEGEGARQPYEAGSPEWWMEEALAAKGWYGGGSSVHI